MARLARVTIPHLPHHITQRGNRDNFVQNLEEQQGRPLLPKKPGPKPRDR